MLKKYFTFKFSNCLFKFFFSLSPHRYKRSEELWPEFNVGILRTSARSQHATIRFCCREDVAKRVQEIQTVSWKDLLLFSKATLPRHHHCRSFFCISARCPFICIHWEFFENKFSRGVVIWEVFQKAALNNSNIGERASERDKKMPNCLFRLKDSRGHNVVEFKSIFYTTSHMIFLNILFACYQLPFANWLDGHY